MGFAVLRLPFRCASHTKPPDTALSCFGPCTRAGRPCPSLALLPHSRVTLPLYLKCLLTFVVAVDLTVTASDVKMPAKTNKTETTRYCPFGSFWAREPRRERIL